MKARFEVQDFFVELMSRVLALGPPMVNLLAILAVSIVWPSLADAVMLSSGRGSRSAILKVVGDLGGPSSGLMPKSVSSRHDSVFSALSLSSSISSSRVRSAESR